MERLSPTENHKEHEGEKYLKLLDLGDLADVDIPGQDKKMRDFLDLCGEHARPLLIGLDSLDRDDPRFEATKAALSQYIAQFVQSAES